MNHEFLILERSLPDCVLSGGEWIQVRREPEDEVIGKMIEVFKI